MVENIPGRPCAIASALQVVGERWALLAVREISLGNTRFDRIVRNTGAPRDRMAARLRLLEASGVVERKQYSERPPRFEYHLTPAGKDLRAVLQVLRQWGDRWAVDAPPVSFTHEACGHQLEATVTCAHCHGEVTGDDVGIGSQRYEWDAAGPLDVG